MFYLLYFLLIHLPFKQVHCSSGTCNTGRKILQFHFYNIVLEILNLTLIPLKTSIPFNPCLKKTKPPPTVGCYL